jgi:hypothetical protein
MNGSTVIRIDGREYHVRYSICRGSRAARENGQPISPDEPDHVDDLEVYALKKIRVTNQKIINKAYENLSEEL